ncbi:MAG: amino acid carrier protein [Clostridia bacterium]|nr:amino acid carrier protein [Clostridia bacterium]
MLRWVLTGGLIPVFLLLGGVLLLFYLKGYPFRSPRAMGRALRASAGENGVSPFRALTQALAGTLGVGNIVGVANAILVGGAGAVLWMWVSALLAMILKYAEILLAVRHRRRGSEGFFGGAVYYIKDCFAAIGRTRAGKLLSGVFAVLMILNALSMGCVIQINAVAESLDGVLGIPPILCGAVLAALALPLLIRGMRGVSALTEYLVPIMTAGYVILSVAVLILRRDAVGDAFLAILRGAFSGQSALGGVLGFLTSRALRVGTMRGLLSNEAGCGTAPTAHASASVQSAAAQGVFGICEVFVDTILLCTATALVILVSGEGYGTGGVMMTVRAYTVVLGDGAGVFLALAILCFGAATVLCWGAYGLESLRFLSERRRWRMLYFSVFALCILLGTGAVGTAVWDLADFCITALTVINLTALFLSRREIRGETLRFCREKQTEKRGKHR